MSVIARLGAAFLALFLWQANAHADLASIRKSAGCGDAERQLELGILYEYGFGYKGKNQVPALTWYMLSAEQGVAKAAIHRDALLAKLTTAQVQQARDEADKIKKTGEAGCAAVAGLKPEQKPNPVLTPAEPKPTAVDTQPPTTPVTARRTTAPAATASATTPAPKTDESPLPFTGNLGIFSNYVFRGVSRTSEKPAFQLGLDYAHPGGVYVGVWGSNVNWLNDSGIYTGSTAEFDGYLGYRGAFGKSDFGYDVGSIFYSFDGRMISYINSAKTHEAYAGLSWKWITVKYSYAYTDYFNIPDSQGTAYADVSVSYPIGKTGVTLFGHVGHVRVSGNRGLNDPLYGYTDGKLGVSYAFPQNFILGAYYADTNALASSYTFNGRNWADNQYVVYIQKTF